MTLQDSKDSIEQLCGKCVLENFPNYEVFWRQFIGNPNAERPEPYTYVFPTNMGTEEQEMIQKRYEKVQIAHYSLFCQLAGAHFQLKELRNSESIKEPRERYFRHWEHFEAGYLHLGSIFYLLEALWNVVIKLQGVPQHKFGEDFLLSRKENKLAMRLMETQDNVKTVRDLMVHRGRAFTSLYHKDKFYIPLRVSVDMVWSQSFKVKENIETVQSLDDDILATEKLLNDLHTLLIDEYGSFIKSKNIKIDYEVKK
jgi:hypothetical protein